MGTINVSADVSCSWPREAPEFTIEQIDEINLLEATPSLMGVLGDLDDFSQKHNELFRKNCLK